MIRQIVLSVFILLSVGGCSEQVFSLSSGKSLSLSEFKGNWLLINYWAEWCAPCRDEIPELNEMNASKEIAVLGYNYDGLADAALDKQVKTLSIKFEQLVVDPATMFDLDTPTSLPSTIIISPDGALVKVLRGKVSKELIKELMIAEG